MIDIHTHILPGIDDGSKTPEESIQLLQTESLQGITVSVLTPHFYVAQNNIPGFLKQREQSWERLEPYLTTDLPSIRLGAEVQYFDGICSVEGLEDLKIEGSNILLLEMPFSKWSGRMIRDVLELNGRDSLQILLAHIERYIPFGNKQHFSKLLDGGLMFQSNVSFFCHWKTRLQAMSMLNNGMIHILGSDCHDLKHRPPAWDALPQKAQEHAQNMSLLFSRSLSQETDPFL